MPGLRTALVGERIVASFAGFPGEFRDDRRRGRRRGGGCTTLPLSGTGLPVQAVMAPALASIQSYLLHLHQAALVYAVVAGLVFAEVALVVAFFVPGEVSAVIGGVLAGEHVVSLPVMMAVVAGAAIIGNGVGYLLGYWIGPWLLRRKLLARHDGVRRARELVDRRGAPGVLIGRFIAVLRALVPGISGIAGMRVASFAVYSVIGGVTWAVLWVAVGDAVGRSFPSVLHLAEQWTIVIVVVAVVLGVAGVLVVRRRGSRSRPSVDRDDATGAAKAGDDRPAGKRP